MSLCLQSVANLNQSINLGQDTRANRTLSLQDQMMITPRHLTLFAFLFFLVVS